MINSAILCHNNWHEIRSSFHTIKFSINKHERIKKRENWTNTSTYRRALHLIPFSRSSRWTRGLTTRGTHFPRNTSRPRVKENKKEREKTSIAIDTRSLSLSLFSFPLSTPDKNQISRELNGTTRVDRFPRPRSIDSSVKPISLETAH